MATAYSVAIILMTPVMILAWDISDIEVHWSPAYPLSNSLEQCAYGFNRPNLWMLCNSTAYSFDINTAILTSISLSLPIEYYQLYGFAQLSYQIEQYIYHSNVDGTILEFDMINQQQNSYTTVPSKALWARCIAGLVDKTGEHWIYSIGGQVKRDTLRWQKSTDSWEEISIDDGGNAPTFTRSKAVCWNFNNSKIFVTAGSHDVTEYYSHYDNVWVRWWNANVLLTNKDADIMSVVMLPDAPMVLLLEQATNQQQYISVENETIKTMSNSYPGWDYPGGIVYDTATATIYVVDKSNWYIGCIFDNNNQILISTNTLCNGFVTSGPTTFEPTTFEPTTAAPTTYAPTTTTPTTDTPTTDTPITDTPTTATPTTTALTTINPTNNPTLCSNKNSAVFINNFTVEISGKNISSKTDDITNNLVKYFDGDCSLNVRIIDKGNMGTIKLIVTVNSDKGLYTSDIKSEIIESINDPEVEVIIVNNNAGDSNGNDEKKMDDTSNMLYILIMVVIILILIIVILLLVLFFMKMKNKKVQQQKIIDDNLQSVTSQSIELGPTTFSSSPQKNSQNNNNHMVGNVYNNEDRFRIGTNESNLDDTKALPPDDLSKSGNETDNESIGDMYVENKSPMASETPGYTTKGSM